MTIIHPSFLKGNIQEFINESDQIQQAGFDLTVKSREMFQGNGRLTLNNSDRIIPNTIELPLESNFYNLQAGGYIVRYNEIVEIPSDAIALVLPRSSLMRMGSSLHSAVWDPGYRGRGMALLTVTHLLQIEKNSRIGQIIFIKLNKVASQYSGIYQDEGIE